MLKRIEQGWLRAELVGALHLSTTENRILRRQLSERADVIRVLPTQPGTAHAEEPVQRGCLT